MNSECNLFSVVMSTSEPHGGTFGSSLPLSTTLTSVQQHIHLTKPVRPWFDINKSAIALFRVIGQDEGGGSTFITGDDTEHTALPTSDQSEFILNFGGKSLDQSHIL